MSSVDGQGPAAAACPDHVLRCCALPDEILHAGEGEARSVEGQVQQLLQEAADPDRLCRMYVGWAAWL